MLDKSLDRSPGENIMSGCLDRMADRLGEVAHLFGPLEEKMLHAVGIKGGLQAVIITYGVGQHGGEPIFEMVHVEYHGGVALDAPERKRILDLALDAEVNGQTVTREGAQAPGETVGTDNRQD